MKKPSRLGPPFRFRGVMSLEGELPEPPMQDSNAERQWLLRYRRWYRLVEKEQRARAERVARWQGLEFTTALRERLKR
jgi:hypothetical protein